MYNKLNKEFMRKIMNYYSAFKTLKPKQLLSVLLIMFVTSGCSDIIEGGIHVGYGIATIIFTVLKWALIIGGVIVVLAFIIGLFNR